MTHLRFANLEDAEQIAAIYGPFCSDTPVSFELTPPSTTDMAGRIEKVLEQYPWLVCEHQGQVVGYAYASRFRDRPAYGWSAESTVYIGEVYRGCGVGRALYQALLELLRLQGCRTVIAGITVPNEGSFALHRSFGFEDAGVYKHIGYKMGKWWDVAWLQLDLRPAIGDAVHSPTVRALDLPANDVEAVFRFAEQRLRIE